MIHAVFVTMGLQAAIVRGGKEKNRAEAALHSVFLR
jgi:hypothetical protein